MATIHWTNQVNGDFSTAADWGGGAVPGPLDDAVLDASGNTSYTVTSSANEAVNSIQTARTATLSITNGTFAASAGTGTGGNAGSILVGDATVFDVGGSMNNSGLVAVNSLGSTTELFLTANTTFSGAGHLTLSDNTNNFVFGTAPTTTLTNKDNTISGAGNIGNGQMTLINQKAGVIDATGANVLTLNTGGAIIVNAGLLEATGAGGLAFGSVTVNDSTGGVITAGTGSVVNITNADIIGGTLQSLGNGVVKLNGSATLDAATAPMTLIGALNIGDASALTIKGAFTNKSNISIGSAGSTTEVVLSANTTLSGGGQVTLSDNTNNYVFGAAASDTLVNVDNTISGAGNIGNGQMILTNQKAGVINAIGANALVINLGGQALGNLGLLEGTGAGGLTINNALVDNTAGSIRANANSGVSIENSTVNNAGGGGISVANGAIGTLQGADIIGGALKVVGTGAFRAVAGGASELDGTKGAVTLNGPLSLNDAANLGLAGSIVNSGTISVNSQGSTTVLDIDANTTLSGGGQLIIGDNVNNYVQGAAATDKLVNVNNTISGAGNLGHGQMTLVNQVAGLINAVGANALVIDTGSQTFVNAGIVEATGQGGLIIQSATVNNAGGTIKANGASLVTLVNTDVIGGTFTAVGTGAIRTSGTDEFDGRASAVILSGAINVLDSSNLQLAGAITNGGAISVGSAGSTTILTMLANTTLSGGGSVVLSDNFNNYVQGAAASDSLVNVDNTISGAGHIGNGQLTLINQAAGVINAVGANALIINTGGQAATNLGLMEATGAGGLIIQGTSVINAGATIRANTGALVTLNSADIVGGTLAVLGSGEFVVTGASELDGSASTLTLAGPLLAQDASALELAGAIANKSTIMLNSGGSTTELLMVANTTLSGGGHVTLTDNANNFIFGSSTFTLVNVDNIISGAGHIGNGQLTLINQAAGIINAVGANALVINTGGQAATNLGLIEATGAGGLTFQTTVNNAGGTIRANTGALVTLNGADIVGGTLGVQGSGGFTVSGSAELDGTTSTLSLGGPLLVRDSTVLSLAGAIANSGTIELNSGGSTTELVMASNTTLSGGGHVTLTDNLNNYVFGSSTISLNNVDNTISGAGNLGNGQLILLNQKAGVIDATGANALIINTAGNTVTNAGLIETTGTGGLTIASPISNTGTLLAHTAILTVVGPLTNISGATLTGGTYEADAGATLELPQNTSIVTDKATIILNGTGSAIEALNTTTGLEVAIDSTLTTVATTGVLEVLGGRNWTTKAAMSNAGLLQLGGGTFAAKSLSNTGTTIGFGSITAPLTNSGVLSVQASKTLSLGVLTNLSGTVLTGGTYIVGAGATLQLAKNLTIVTLNATIDLAGVGATLQSLNTATSTQVSVDSTLATIGSTGVLEVLGGRSYTTTNAIANGGSLQLGGGVFTSGTLTDTAASILSGFGTIASVFSDGGKITASGGALAFKGVGDTFSGAIGGTEVDFAGGSDALNAGTSLGVATLGLSGGAAVTLGTGFAFGGMLIDGAGTTLSLGSNTLTLTGAGSTIGGTVSGVTGSVLVFGGGSQALNTGASLGAKTWSLSGGDATFISTNLSYAGTFSEATGSSLSVAAADTLGFTGAVTLAGAVSGFGTLSQSGGTEAINTGATLGVAAWALKSGAAVSIHENLSFGGALSEDAASSITIGAGDTLTLNGTAAIAGTLGASGAVSLTAGATATIGGTVGFGGAFSQGAATTTVSSGDTFDLQGTATFGAGAIVNGAGTLTLSNATVSGLTVGGTLTLSDLGVVDQIGSITLGDTTSSAAKLIIGKGDTYILDGNVGIARGKSASSAMTVTGTLIKNAGAGVSIVGVKASDAGLIEVATGTLDFTQALAGKGGLKIDAGATLQIDNTAAGTLTATFNGAGAILALSKAAKFAATINGFTTGQTIDLLKTAATAATLNGSDQLVIVNGSTTVATLQLSGNYSGFVFNVGSDGHAGSAITLSPSPGAELPNANAFVQAMSQVGANAGAEIGRGPVGWAAPAPHGSAIALAPGHHGALA